MRKDEILDFIGQYPPDVAKRSAVLRDAVKSSLSNITEQLDIPAKMISYCYGQRYADMVCVIFPSRKGLKLSFYKGVDLPDPENILKGTAKTTRYVEIKTEADSHSSALKQLLQEALEMYYQRMKSKS